MTVTFLGGQGEGQELSFIWQLSDVTQWFGLKAEQIYLTKYLKNKKEKTQHMDYK